jgi:SAM-dependent methyltransferase
MRRELFAIYHALEQKLVPGLKYIQYVYEEVLESHINGATDWLDIGCGRKLLPAWRLEEEKQLISRCHKVIGVDGDLASLKKHCSINNRVLGTIGQLPFPAESFDLVTANMVVEHLDQPAAQFREIARVLKPGGEFIFHTPNKSGYSTLLARMVPEWAKKTIISLLEARAGADVFKTWYKVNDRAEIEHIAVAAGFVVVQMMMLNTSAEMAVVTPLALIELLWLRLLMNDRLKYLRTNIIAVLEKRPV